MPAPKRAKVPPPQTPAPTPEFTALTPQLGEASLDALARVGDEIVTDVGGSDARDARKDKKLPRQLAALVALRAQGFDNTEIAAKLNCAPGKLRALIAKARRDYGWNDLSERLVDVALPQAIENVIKHLDHENTAMALLSGQSTMTRATVGGLGLFKTHAAVKQETKNETLNVLRVEITLPQMPPGVQGSMLTDGSVLATPRRALVSTSIPAPGASPVVDGEVVSAG